jgi:hypothetical protein
MKISVKVQSVEELEELCAGLIEIHEAPPAGANPEDAEDPFIGEEGILTVETDEIEVEAVFSVDVFPDNISIEVLYTGWDETLERVDDAHGLETHSPAVATMQLENKWLDNTTKKSVAIYKVSAEH